MRKDVNERQHNIAQTPSQDANHLQRKASHAAKTGNGAIVRANQVESWRNHQIELADLPRLIGQTESKTGLVRCQNGHVYVRSKDRPWSSLLPFFTLRALLTTAVDRFILRSTLPLFLVRSRTNLPFCTSDRFCASSLCSPLVTLHPEELGIGRIG